MKAELYCKAFHGLDLMCMCSSHPMLIWRKMGSTFLNADKYISFWLEHIIFTTKLKNHLYKVTCGSCSCALKSQAWQAFTYCAAKCNPLLSLCEEDFQRYIFHRLWQAVWSDNKQRGVRRREVIKTCSHIIIPTPSPSLRIFFFSRPSLPFRSLSPSQMKGPSQATWEMKMMERLIKKKSEKKKMESGFEVARHISWLPPSDLPI